MSMRYVKFGSSWIKVSPIAFGLGFRQQRSLKEAQRIIEYAIDLGVNLFDCANNYSLTDSRKSEEVLGTVLEKRRDDILITSKVNTPTGNGPNDRGTSRFHILREIENSLRRLRTDHLDIYLLHAYDPDTTLDETLRAMDDLVTAGINITRPPGPMKHGTRVIAFCEDPDGYKIELNEKLKLK